MSQIKRLCFAALFATLLWVACGSPVIYRGDAGDHTHVVARVDTFYEVTMAQLYDSIYASKTLPHGGVLSTHDVKLFLDSMLCDSLAGLAARNVRLGDYYQDHRMYRLRYQKALLQTFLDEMIYGRVTADSAEIHDFYLSRPDLFSVDEQVLLYHILVSPVNLKHGPDSAYYWSLSSEEFDTALEDYALRLRNLIDIGIPFDEVARDYSHDTYTGQGGGFVGWTKKGVYFPPFDSVAFSLNAGEIAQYVDRDGWHIILVAEHVDEGLPPFGPDQHEASRQTLLTIKANTRGREVMDSLIAEPRDIVYNEAILDTNVYLVDKHVWAAIVNGADTIDFNELRILEDDYRR
ncbi:MAG: peptidylprolyl isomerase, partial [candidate division Zixibacteria bacterium]|nr:peptidylprolyl isomerase [candidate division Zixibacteria bacterium]